MVMLTILHDVSLREYCKCVGTRHLLLCKMSSRPFRALWEVQVRLMEEILLDLARLK